MSAIANGNLTQTVADAGAAPHLNATTTSVYNAYGKAILTTDPMGTATQFQYDSFQNLISSVANYGAGSGYLNATTRYAYDAAGNVVAKTDPNGNTTTMTYDAARRLLSTTAPINLAQTVNGYDADGHLISVTRVNPGANQVTRTTYTPTGKVRTVTDPNGNITTNAYDPNDRLQSVAQPVQRTTSFSYDAVGRLTKVVDATGNASEQYAYTANGKQASFTDARGNATTYAYDGFDRLTQTTFPIGSTGGHTSENIGYDANDNLVSRRTRALATISFAYDTLNRRCTKTISTSPTACTATTSASPTVWFGYDLNGRATSLIDNSTAITAAVLPVPGTPVSYATTTSYDRLNRPVNVSFSPAPASATPAPGSVTFAHAYNAVNQRVGQTVTDNSWWFYPAAAASTVGYTSNAANQYTAVGAVTPSYDGNGNLTSDGSFSYNYDAENRLTSATATGNINSYAYDAQGRRKTRTSNGTTTVTVTDADNRPVLEYAGSSGALLRWYAYGLGSNDILSQITLGGTRATMVPDIQGSVLATLNSATGVFARQNYLPYGKSASTSITGTFGYTGQRIDAETGLYNYRARMYHAGWGRFLQTDPLGMTTADLQPGPGGTGNRGNLYAYVGNDPLNQIDPTGLWGLGVTASGSLEGGALVAGAGATGAVGAGVFWGGNAGLNAGGFASGGAFAGGPMYGANAFDPLAGGTTAAAGGFAGIGAGGYFTNATSTAGLKGVFNNYSLNTPIGSIQLGISGDTFIVSVTVGPGGGFAASTYSTNTIVTPK